ncbi:MAG: hypothetical protein Q4C04_02215 [Clostridia bacterium]|nr:hypothetical protein [Clostridia bacterium]
MLYFIPLISSEGKAIGSLRVDGDLATLKLKSPFAGRAFLILEDGIEPISPDVPTRIGSPVRAVAAVEDGRLLFYGLAPNSTLDKGAIRPMLSQKSTNNLRFSLSKAEENAKVPVANADGNATRSIERADSRPGSDETANAEPLKTAETPVEKDGAEELNADDGVKTHHEEAVKDLDIVEESDPPTESEPSHARADAPEEEPDPPTDSEASHARADAPEEKSDPPTDPEASHARTDAPEEESDPPESEAKPILREAAAESTVDQTANETLRFSKLLEHSSEVFARIGSVRPVYREREGGTASETLRVSGETQAEPAVEAANSKRAYQLQNPWIDMVNALLETRIKQAENSATGKPENPFESVFPGSTWKEAEAEGYPPHLEGSWTRGNESFKLIAVPGNYAPRPPKQLSGFTRFVRTPAGGYWIKLIEGDFGRNGKPVKPKT